MALTGTGTGQGNGQRQVKSRAPLPETKGYKLKRMLLGPPLVSEQLEGERLSDPIALGVLAPDCISSSAYGTEEMLNILVPRVGLAAFTLVLPVTGVILVILTLVTLSYREVVMVYTRAGGAYVVARENFGPLVAQVAAVALLIDYTVTVAVQSAAGTDALASAVPAVVPYIVPVTVVAVLILLWGNLRGIKEAGRIFALPTYFFIGSISVVIIVGLLRKIFGHLPVRSIHVPGVVPIGHPGNGLLMGATLALMLKALANGGSSLTGLEAISNGVSSFRQPAGPHARRVLVIMSLTLAFLVAGVSILARLTHAVPFVSGAPTVISQEAKIVFGPSFLGHAGFLIVQLATLLVLYTGANTSFNGFPFLASFVAEDAFLPRKLTRRGHRLAFSNGIVVLAVLSIALLLVTRAKVDSLVAVYAIGVFTGFTMAGAGMVKHHLREREKSWRRKMMINGGAAVLSAVVVVILAVFKFTQGAWVVVVLFPLLTYALIRLNRRYREEAVVLGETVAERAAEAHGLDRDVVLVLIDRMDLATARAIQYARTLSVDDLRAVHFVLDTTRAQRLQERWITLGFRHLPLELIECPDRRLIRACLELADETADADTQVTLLLPRRAYGTFWARLLHDQTAEHIAQAVSRLQNVNATIVPFDVGVALDQRRQEAEEAAVAAKVESGRTGSKAIASRSGSRSAGSRSQGSKLHRGSHRSAGTHSGEAEVEKAELAEDAVVLRRARDTLPIKDLTLRQRVRVGGRVHSVTIQPWGGSPTLECALGDETGRITVAFLGRRELHGVAPGTRMVVEGTVGSRRGQLMIINPSYELLAPVVES